MGNENFCMIGYHAVPVLADAITKGIKVDKPLALEAMVSSSTIPYYGNLKEYMELGYVPFDKIRQERRTRWNMHSTTGRSTTRPKIWARQRSPTPTKNAR